jgi:hypothetical protein
MDEYDRYSDNLYYLIYDLVDFIPIIFIFDYLYPIKHWIDQNTGQSQCVSFGSHICVGMDNRCRNHTQNMLDPIHIPSQSNGPKNSQQIPTHSDTNRFKLVWLGYVGMCRNLL